MSSAGRGVACEGWWDEKGWGRQPMLELWLQFDAGQISGSGHDVVGPFLFAGAITAQGHVTMVKEYVGQHTVDYVGTYDGEGLMWGQWHIGALSDRWMIKFNGSKTAALKQTIEELV